MSSRATLSLAVVTALLAAFIYFYERETVSTSDREARRGRVIESFARDRVHRIELERGEERLVFERERDEEGAWRYFQLLEPIRAAADDDAVESLLAALDWAMPVSVIEEVEESELAQFGLDQPRLSVRVFTGSRSAELSVGNATPSGIERYALGERRDQILIIPEDLVENLSHDLFHFRSKALIPEGLAGLRRIERLSNGERLVMERDLRSIRIVEPVQMLANSSRAERLLRSLETLSAKTILSETRSPEYDAALKHPELRFDLTMVEERMTLLIGGECEGRESERIAVRGQGPVVCVAEADLDGLDLAPDRLEERRLASARDYDVERFSLRLGERRLEVTLTDETSYRLFEGEREIERGEVDESSFTEWLRLLRLAEATERRIVSRSDLGRYGLDSPRGELRIVERGPLKLERKLEIGAEKTAALYASDAEAAGETRVVLGFPPDVAELLTPSVFRLRSRVLLDAEAYRVRSITLREGDAERELDPREYPTLTARLAELEAIEFVADRARREFGLEEPALTLRFTVDAGHSHGGAHEGDSEAGEYLLEIGARVPAERAEDGGKKKDAYYARLSGSPHVFTVSAVLVEAARNGSP